MSPGFQPRAVNFSHERDNQIREEYGSYTAIDVSDYVMGVVSDLPEVAECGCRIRASERDQIRRAREEFHQNEVQGKKLFALLGSYAFGEAGPLVTMRLDDGTVIVVLSADVARSNPVMTVTEGDVKISSRELIDDKMRAGPRASGSIRRAYEKLTGLWGRFRLIESVRGGSTLTISTLRTYDYSLIHPTNRCKKTASGGHGINGNARDGCPSPVGKTGGDPTSHRDRTRTVRPGAGGESYDRPRHRDFSGYETDGCPPRAGGHRKMSRGDSGYESDLPQGSLRKRRHAKVWS